MRLRHTLFLMLLLLGAAGAANLAQEQRIAELLSRGSLTGEARWLAVDELRFLSILIKSSADRQLGGAILLHDAGDHADEPQVIGPLRRHLAKRGWDTLSLQLPRPLDPLSASDREAAIPPAVARLRAAVADFAARGITDLVLVGHGLGAEMALAYLDADPAESVRGLVAIGLAAGSADAEDPVLQRIARLQRPLLDLHGDRDSPAVLDTAQARRSAARRNKREGYRQDLVMGADHHFSGLQSSLRQRVASWLRRVAQQSPARMP